MYGGIAAEILCIENDDPAAERFALLLDGAGIDVGSLAPWNACPWYINRKPNATELKAGLDPLLRLLNLLPNIEAITLNGGDAQALWRILERTHPSIGRS